MRTVLTFFIALFSLAFVASKDSHANSQQKRGAFLLPIYQEKPLNSTKLVESLKLAVSINTEQVFGAVTEYYPSSSFDISIKLQDRTRLFDQENSIDACTKRENCYVSIVAETLFLDNSVAAEYERRFKVTKPINDLSKRK